jgi:hypothetical protein
MTSMRRTYRSIRDVSPRQLPTNHDYAVSTREYQSDQPSRQPHRPPPRLPDQINVRRPGRLRRPRYCGGLLDGLNDDAEELTQRSDLTGRSISEVGVTAKWTNHGAGHLRERQPWRERHGIKQQMPAT